MPDAAPVIIATGWGGMEVDMAACEEVDCETGTMAAGGVEEKCRAWRVQRKALAKAQKKERKALLV